METQNKNGNPANSGTPAVKGNDEAVLKRTITDAVLSRITPMVESGELVMPSNYVFQNAITAALFSLQDNVNKDGVSVLKTCTQRSIANALFEMVVFGLSVSKKQIALIAYGDTLKCQIQYQGNMQLAKRYGKVKTINANVIYTKDDFKYSVNVDSGVKKIIHHEQLFENIIDSEIKGAYAVLTFEDGSEPYVEIMTKAQIDKAWLQGAMKGQSPAHKNFPGEMCKKTVINRACKLFIESSDDSSLADDDIDDTGDPSIASRDAKIERSGKKELSLEPYEDLTNKAPEFVTESAQAPAPEEAPY